MKQHRMEDFQKIDRELAERYQAYEESRERRNQWIVIIVMIVLMGTLCLVSHSWLYFLVVTVFLCDCLWHDHLGDRITELMNRP